MGERMVELYINDELIPYLKKNEGWTDIIYTNAWFKNNAWDVESFRKLEEEMEARLLLSNGYYPTKDFWEQFKGLTSSLSNTPDGFLIKMNRTGRYGNTTEALKEFNITSDATLSDLNGNPLLEKPKGNKILPIVDGTIEVVEVKSGKSVYTLQVPSYRNAVANGYPLRLFKVNLEKSEIKEKLIVNLDEVASTCFKQMTSVGKYWSL
jgi:hypothetical protein